MNIQEFLKATYYNPQYPSLSIWRNRIFCKDGFSMSVQASDGHYCLPRMTTAEQYTHVEIGFPNQAEPLILQYAEEPDDLTETVYPYTPIEIVQQVIDKHGGIDIEKTKPVPQK